MTTDVVVTKIHQETDHIRSFELVLKDGGALPSYSAGSHLTFALPNGMERTYSLTDSGSEPDAFRIAVLNQSGGRGGSRYFHDTLIEGATLRIIKRANTFPLALDSKRHILIAGGIGITPILSMARHLDEVNAEFEVHYGARSAADAAFYRVLQASRFAHRITFYFDDRGERIPLDRIFDQYLAETTVYCCGPNGLNNAVLKLGSSWPEGSVRLDFFEAPKFSGEDRPFRVRLLESGKEYEIPINRSILSVLRENGVAVESQCEQGVCGACLATVVDGIPEHRDAVLTEAEKNRNDLMTLCCSRAVSDTLVLDL